jgi:hypothetical protein
MSGKIQRVGLLAFKQSDIDKGLAEDVDIIANKQNEIQAILLKDGYTDIKFVPKDLPTYILYEKDPTTNFWITARSGIDV